tara:strand:- start:302 stop:502 length:201 start_codon:yes stop_codon:yes gene_type:complete
MPPKLKPSTKQYERDSRGRMTQKWKWVHYTPSNTSTEELKKMYESSSYSRKKNLIKKELIKRNEII